MLIRPATIDDIPAISRVNVDSWRTTYRGIVPADFLQALSYSRQEERNKRYSAEPGICLVAELPGKGVIGYVRGGAERSKHPDFQVEVYALYLLQQYQHQGIGTALLRHWFAAQESRGFHSALVWVLEQNKPAVGFYKRMGGRFVCEKFIELGGQQLLEHAYGWDDFGCQPT
jgi:ribosomal protein S18 acetylase RimI-like enzyme